MAEQKETKQANKLAPIAKGEDLTALVEQVADGLFTKGIAYYYNALQENPTLAKLGETIAPVLQDDSENLARIAWEDFLRSDSLASAADFVRWYTLFIINERLRNKNMASKFQEVLCDVYGFKNRASIRARFTLFSGLAPEEVFTFLPVLTFLKHEHITTLAAQMQTTYSPNARLTMLNFTQELNASSLRFIYVVETLKPLAWWGDFVEAAKSLAVTQGLEREDGFNPYDLNRYATLHFLTLVAFQYAMMHLNATENFHINITDVLRELDAMGLIYNRKSTTIEDGQVTWEITILASRIDEDQDEVVYDIVEAPIPDYQVSHADAKVITELLQQVFASASRIGNKATQIKFKIVAKPDAS